ncbi:MAG: hypothetical protein ACKVW3_14120 [Phycisphaerales bacterium]
MGIVGRWYGVPATADVIHFMMAPELSAGEVNQSIRTLQSQSAIIFRRFNQTFNLWEGSDIDVDARLSAARADLPASTATAKLLQDHYSTRPLVARRHSYRTGTLRYFEVAYVSPDTLSDNLAVLDKAPADGHILVVLPGPERSRSDSLERLAETHAARPDLLIVLPANAREVDSLARDLACISWVKTKTPELVHDATARHELQSREAELRRRLERETAGLLIPKSDSGGRSRWFHQGRLIRVRDLRELNEHLSDICDDHYRLCPQVQNEIINRRELSSSAAAARRNLIQHMITDGEREELAIEGNPPERSIYLSVIVGMGLHHPSGDRWGFASTLGSIRKDAKPMFKAIRDFFDAAHTEPRSIDKFFHLLRSAPYGIRDGLLPIILCAALLGSEADVALYEEGAFLPELSVATFERLMKDPSRFMVRRWRVTGVRATVFEHLAELLGQERVTDRIERRDVLDVVKPLMRFVRKLDAFSQQTRSLSPEATAVRDVLLRASEPDRLLFHDLPEACGIQAFHERKRSRGDDAATFLATFRRVVGELQRAYENLLTSVSTSLRDALEGSGSGASMRKKLARRAQLVGQVALEPEVKVFEDRAPPPSAMCPTRRHSNARSVTTTTRTKIGSSGSQLIERTAFPWASELAQRPAPLTNLWCLCSGVRLLCVRTGTPIAMRTKHLCSSLWTRPHRPCGTQNTGLRVDRRRMHHLLSASVHVRSSRRTNRSHWLDDPRPALPFKAVCHYQARRGELVDEVLKPPLAGDVNRRGNLSHVGRRTGALGMITNGRKQPLRFGRDLLDNAHPNVLA